MLTQKATGWTAGVLLALGSTAPASDPALKLTVVAQEGDAVAGVGNVTTINNLAVNNLGQVLVEVDTDNANTDIDNALLLDGVLLLQEGDLLGAPAGAGINSFDTVNLNNLGNSGWNFFLENTSGSSDDSGIYFNTTLRIQEGDVSSAAGFSPGTPFRGFFECKINDSDEIIMVASVDDPAISSSVDQALMHLDSIGTQTVILKEADAAPGLGGPLVSTFGTGPHSFDFNNAGDVMFFVDTDAVTTDDGVIYLNTTVLAREGQPAPVSGRNWLSLSGAEMSMNNQGDYVFSGRMDGSTADDTVIIRNGQVFRQEGDPLLDIAPFLLTSFGSGPLLVADRGDPVDADPDVIWFGDWDDPDTTRDTGLFLNDKLLLQEGVDMIGGIVIDDLRGIQDGYSVSDDGRYILVELQLNGSIDTALLIDRGPWNNLGHSLAGTSGDPRLRMSGSLLAGDDLSACLTGAAPSRPTFLVVGLTRLDLAIFGGTMVPFPNLFLGGLSTDADGVINVTATNSSPGASGAEIFLQWWIPDAAGPKGFAASNCVRGVFP